MSEHMEAKPGRRTLLDVAVDRPMLTSALLLGLILGLSCSLLRWPAHGYVPFERRGLPMPREFILASEDVPEGWEQSFVLYSRRYPSVFLPYVRVESHVSFRSEQTQELVSHTVGAQAPIDRAARSFEEEVAFRGPLYDPLPPWPPLADWEYASPHADQYVLWIGIRGEPPYNKLVVMSVAQYEYYISRLWLEGDPELVSPEDVQQLVLAADAMFADLEQRLAE